MKTFDALERYDEPMPEPWEEMIHQMESAGGDSNHREAQRARLDVALSATSVHLASYVADRESTRSERVETATQTRHDASLKDAEDTRTALWRMHDARLEDAEKTRESMAAAERASNRQARSLTWATWALAVATFALILVTALKP